MSKLQVQIIKPTTPNEKFHILENTTELDQMPNDNTWDLIKLCLNHSDLNLRILGVYLNAVMTENKLTHLLSGRILIKLLKSQNLISRKTLSNQHASEIVNWFEEQGHIKILKPAGFKVAGVVTVTVDEVVEFVNKVLGEEVSNQYTESVLGFYKGVDEECQKELASTPVADDVSEE